MKMHLRSVVVKYNHQSYKFDLVKLEQASDSVTEYIFKPEENDLNTYNFIIAENVKLKLIPDAEDFSTDNEALQRNAGVFAAFKKAVLDSEAK